MKITADHERDCVEVELPLNGFNSFMVFRLGINEVSALATFVDREFHFREDLMQELERMVNNGDYDKTLLDDSDLIEAVLDDYCDNRSNHGAGSGSDDVWPWTESLHQAMMDHHTEIRKYRVDKTAPSDTGKAPFFPAGDLTEEQA